MSIQVLRAGLLSSVQDGGRCGLQHLGVAAAGAMDPIAAMLANALVGNRDGDAVLEMTVQGPRLRLNPPTLIAITGAECDVRLDGQPLPLWRPLLLCAGSEIDCGGMRHGARSYLAVAGGIDAPATLGSRSSDVNGAIGPAPLVNGASLACAAAPRDRYPGLWRALEHGARPFASPRWWLDATPWLERAEPLLLHTLRGAHFDALDAESQQAWFGETFTVAGESNRVGYRLLGPALRLKNPLELVSEGVIAGTVQLPPAGQPIVLMAEHPTTGGYPRIAHVAAIDLPKLGQLRPGQSLRFVEIDLAQAQQRYLVRTMHLERLRRAIADRLLD